NDQYVQNMPLFKIYYLLKGNPGTTVKISLYESALEKPQDFTLTRRATTKPYVQSYVAQPKIGYLGVQHLLPGVETEIQTKLDSFAQQGVKDLILDLRNCTEEDQDLAVKVASLFVGSAPVVQISDRTGKTQNISGTGKAQFQGNLIVLQDFTTAGGAEIIAGAIQDTGAGKVFGVRSYGRGGIQKLFPAGQDYVVLTTQKYLTPKGKMILTNGIEPTLPYKEDVKKIDESDDSDRMLNKAIDILRYPDQKAAA